MNLTKLSHHASERNTSPQLLEMLDCSNYIISTDGSLHGLPKKKCIARVVNNSKENVNLYFNYDLKKLIFQNTYENEKIDYKFECITLEGLMEV